MSRSVRRSTGWGSNISRRDFLRRGAAFTGAVGAGGLLAACGDSSSSGSTAAGTTAGGAAAGSKLKGTLAHQSFANANITNQEAFKALDEIHAQLGIKTAKFDYEGDNQRELAQIQQMKAAGVAAASTVIVDSSITRQIATTAVRSDIYLNSLAVIGPWVLACEPSIRFHYQGYATPPDGAYILCTEMFEEMGGRGKFVHIQGSAGTATDTAKTKAVDRALAEYPDVELVGRERANYDQETARVKMDQILTKVGTDVGAVYCQQDAMLLGVVQTLRARGLLGRVLVSGADAFPEVVDLIAAGNVFGTEGIGLPVLWGVSMLMAMDSANGFEFDPIESTMQVDLVIIDTPEAAKAYKQVSNSDVDYGKMSRILHPDDWDAQWPIKHFEPEAFWTGLQGIPKPSGYELPSNYTDAVRAGGYRRIDTLYADHLKSFPYADVVAKSRSRKTAFQVADAG